GAAGRGAEEPGRASRARAPGNIRRGGLCGDSAPSTPAPPSRRVLGAALGRRRGGVRTATGAGGQEPDGAGPVGGGEDRPQDGGPPAADRTLGGAGARAPCGTAPLPRRCAGRAGAAHRYRTAGRDRPPRSRPAAGERRRGRGSRGPGALTGGVSALSRDGRGAATVPTRAGGPSDVRPAARSARPPPSPQRGGARSATAPPRAPGSAVTATSIPGRPGVEPPGRPVECPAVSETVDGASAGFPAPRPSHRRSSG